ncbi:MAG: aromatic-ring-hydroxylating dioxygenase subunit beta [Alphaproteobacteria bacterium]
MTARSARSASPAQLRELRFELEEFNAEYANTLDEYDLDRWVDYFTEDALYRITARENFDANLPLGLVYCEGRGMLKDRALAILKTTTFASRYLRHFLGPARILDVADDGTIHARANYMVVQTELERPSQILQAGMYVDRFARTGGALRLRERHCVYDSLIIPNAIVFPV